MSLVVAGNGTTDLPHGKIAALTIYLEMTLRPTPARVHAPHLALRRLRGDDVDLYLAIFRVFGHRWLWFGRLRMTREAVQTLLDDAGISAYALMHEGKPAGLLELDFRRRPDAELVYFGVFDALIGSGAAHWMMQEALAKAFDQPIVRLFVHTCAFDDPRAVAFYRRAGFIAYKTAIEIADDPRLIGILPRESAPHVPLVD